MRTALRALTTRGRCLLAAGLAAALCALLLGERDLLRVACLLVALPLLAAYAVARTRFRLTCVRALHPGRVPAGRPTDVSLTLRNISLLPSGLLLLEDELPYTLGGRPRFLVDRISPNDTRTVRYVVRSDVRGRYQIGPLRLRLSDPFGLVELARSFTAVDQLTVTPVVYPLPTIRLAGSWDAGGESTSRAVFSRGEDDAATREYRHGDDLRKVHWRSTARIGKLMVRQVEKPWQSHATVLLDTRSAAHRGEGPGSSFEWAVSAAASIGTHLAGIGFSLDLLTDREHPHRSGVDLGENGVLMDYLAEVSTSRNRRFDAVLPDLRQQDHSTLIAVLGILGLDEARTLTAARPARNVNIALLVDATSWVSLAPRARQEATEVRNAATQVLARSGWRVVHVQRGASLPDAWTRAGDRLGASRTPAETS
ncbi:MAG TPA: DUF58 domain-containing protein [Mycobacteriales bacterium]|nr:DUF58 domain-containing protein [Mycobacteriales bacterium]